MPELPSIVRERLKVSRPNSAHPDANVLTAFAERALPEPERAVVSEHLAHCHDCRDILALALPATVAIETARAPLPVRGGWLRAPVFRWGVVAAGVAVFAAAGLMQYQRGHGQQSSVAEIQRYETPAPEAKTAPADSAEESVKLKASAPSVVAPTAGAVASTKRVHADSTIASNGDTPFKKEGVASPLRNAPGMLSTPGTLSVAGPRAGLPLHGPGSRSTTGGSLGGYGHGSLPLVAKQAPSSAEKVETQSQLVATIAPEQAPGRAVADVTVDKAKAPAITTVEVSAAAPVLETETAAATAPSTLVVPRWGISANGGLLRSVDQGKNWASVEVNASVLGGNRMAMAAQQSQAAIRKKATASVSAPIFRAISAAGMEVWAGGSAGALYHSADGGERWARVTPSMAGIVLTGDVVGIAFSDPQHGQITTSTQELWTTSDAGLTWQKQ